MNLSYDHIKGRIGNLLIINMIDFFALSKIETNPDVFNGVKSCMNNQILKTDTNVDNISFILRTPVALIRIRF